MKFMTFCITAVVSWSKRPIWPKYLDGARARYFVLCGTLPSRLPSSEVCEFPHPSRTWRFDQQSRGTGTREATGRETLLIYSGGNEKFQTFRKGFFRNRCISGKFKENYFIHNWVVIQETGQGENSRQLRKSPVSDMKS